MRPDFVQKHDREERLRQKAEIKRALRRAKSAERKQRQFEEDKKP